MKNVFFHLLIVTIVGLAAYSNIFNVPFQFDDIWNIVDNSVVKNPDNFTSSLTGYNYNPRRYIGYLTLALNYSVGGLDVTGYHIVNLAIHILNAALVYLLVILTFNTPYFSNRQSAISNQPNVESNEHRSKSLTALPLDYLTVTFRHSLFIIHHSQFIALFSALLFVSHPLQTQAVTYIVQRFTSLATLFYLLSVVMYVEGRLTAHRAKSKEQSAQLSANGRFPVSSPRSLAPSFRARFTIHHSLVTTMWYLLSLLSAVLAMKTKEIAFTLPVVIVLYEFIFFGSAIKKKILFVIPILLTLMIIPASVLHTDKPLGELLSDLSEKTRVQTEISRGDYLMTEMRVIVTYIRLIFLPINQNLDYDYPIYHSFFTPPVFLSFLVLLALFGTAVYLLFKSRSAISCNKLVVSSKKEEAIDGGPNTDGASLLTTHHSLFTFHYSRLIAFGILWFFITLSVESSFIPITDVIFEHRVYLPSAGAFIALSAIYLEAMRRAERWRIPAAIIFLAPAVIIFILTAATYARNSVWKDGRTLWEDVIKKAPGNARAHSNLGFIYYGKGMLAQAKEHFITALRLRPQYSDARVNLGIVYNAEGMADMAIGQYLIVLSVNPNDADAHNNLGIAYVTKGMSDDAITHYQTALRINPEYPEAYNNLGVVYGNKGLFDKAIGYFSYAIKLKPDYFEAHYNLLRALLKKNDMGQAEVEYRYLLRINPDAAKNLWENSRTEAR